MSTSTMENCLNLDFAPMDPIHQWKRMPECDEFVGARYEIDFPHMVHYKPFELFPNVTL